jgi:lysophospholipase L1-like esterase
MPIHPTATKKASFSSKRPRWMILLVVLCFAVLGSVFLWRSFAANPNLVGDLDNNNVVELKDLSLLLSTWNQKPSSNDISGDGAVGIQDLSMLLSNWNKTYTPTPPTPTPPTPTPPPSSNPTPTRQIKLMPLGSSSVEGTGSTNGSGFRYELYNTLVQTDKLNVDFVGSAANGPTSGYDRNHEGHSGWTIGNNSSLSASVVGWITTYKPDVVIFYAGLNDLRGGASAADTASRFDAIAGKIFATKADIKLIAGTTMKKTDEPSLNTKIVDFNSRMYPIAEKYRSQGKYLQIVDIDGAVTSADHYDSIHANDNGYHKMVPVWLSGIRATYPSL